MSEPAPQYLLDTSIMVHYVRQGVVWERVRADYNLLAVTPRPKFCVVSAGELRSLAIQFKWGSGKVGDVDYCLGYFAQVSIEETDVIERYAEIDAAGRRGGRRMGKNDLWIAATAAATGATLLTADHDFEWLHPLVLTCRYIDPLAE